MKLSELYKGKKIAWTGEEMLNYKPEKTKWLIDGILAYGDQVLLTAPSKTGKSLFSMHLTASLSSGSDFLDEYRITKATKVLYIQTEMTMDQVSDRIQRMNRGIGIDESNIRWLYVPSLPFINPTSGHELIESIGELFPDFVPEVIIFDPIYMLSGGRSLKDDDVVQSIVSNISIIRFHYNATIIINHHNHRPSKTQEGAAIPGDYFGSFIFEAWPDVRFDCSRVGDKGMHISCKADRNGDKVKNLNLTFIDGTSLYFEKDTDPRSKDHMKTVLEFFDAQEQGTIEELVKFVGVNKTLTRGAVKLLLKENKIQEVTKGIYRRNV